MRNGSHALGAALLALVAAVHFGYDPLASWLASPADQQRMARAIYYVSRGIEGAILWGLVLTFAPRTLPVVVACVWGAIECGQAAVCRLVVGLGSVAPPTDAYRGLCDVATGYRVAAMSAVIGLIAACLVQEVDRERRKGR